MYIERKLNRIMVVLLVVHDFQVWGIVNVANEKSLESLST